MLRLKAMHPYKGWFSIGRAQIVQRDLCLETSSQHSQGDGSVKRLMEKLFYLSSVSKIHVKGGGRLHEWTLWSCLWPHTSWGMQNSHTRNNNNNKNNNINLIFKCCPRPWAFLSPLGHLTIQLTLRSDSKHWLDWPNHTLPSCSNKDWADRIHLNPVDTTSHHQSPPLSPSTTSHCVSFSELLLSVIDEVWCHGSPQMCWRGQISGEPPT